MIYSVLNHNFSEAKYSRLILNTMEMNFNMPVSLIDFD